MSEDNKRKINKSKIKTIKYIEDAIDKIDELKENYIAREEAFDINQKLNETSRDINLDAKSLKEWKDRSVKHLREQKRDIKAIYTLEKRSQRKLNALLRPKKLLEKKVQKISNDINKTKSKQEQLIKDIEELEAKIDRAKSLDEKDELTEQLLLKQGSLTKIENKLVKLWGQLAETKVKLNEEIKKLKEIMSMSKYSLSNDDIEIGEGEENSPTVSTSSPVPVISPMSEKEQKDMSEKDKEEIKKIVEGPSSKDKKIEEKGGKPVQDKKEDKKPEEKGGKPAEGNPYTRGKIVMNDDIAEAIDKDEDEEFAKEQRIVANRARLIRLKSMGRNLTKPFKFLGRKIKQLWSRIKLGTNNLLSSANKGVTTAAKAIAENGQKAEKSFKEKREKFTKQYEATLSEEQQIKAREESKMRKQEEFEAENEFDDYGNIL